MRRYTCLAVLALAGCSSQHFTQSDTSVAARTPLPPDCPMRLITVAPPAGTFTELGLCDVAVPGGGMVADFSYKATAKLRECACAAGGNAVLLLSDREVNAFGASQQRVAAKGTVLWIEAKP